MSRLDGLAPVYDLIVIGGGITGAGVLHEAVRCGVSVLLLDRGDFASGTSSASSKLVHGGLRYLRSGQWRMTLESVRERRRLMAQWPGLVEELPFLLPLYRGRKPSRALTQCGLLMYDLMAGRRRSRWLDRDAARSAEPALEDRGLTGAMRYVDARTDDARLVQRLIEDSRLAGAEALNYAPVEDLLHQAGRVIGVRVRDEVGGAVRELRAGMVINATGVWARQFAPALHAAPDLRPLRGSHFVFPAARLPLRHAVTWLHRRDGRAVFAYPWEGAIVAGTTDLDHDPQALDAPRMTDEESAYLVEALADRFPRCALRAEDALCRYAGIRPVIAGGRETPSDESRESALWSAPGLVSLTGGKLTTFRIAARQILAEASRQDPRLAPRPDPERPAGDADGAAEPRLPEIPLRLAGRLGAVRLREVLHPDPAYALLPIPGTPYTQAEIVNAARREQVVHLDDLLLRRTRIGLVTPRGGADLLPRIRALAQPVLGWDDARWETEAARYLRLWQTAHAP